MIMISASSPACSLGYNFLHHRKTLSPEKAEADDTEVATVGGENMEDSTDEGNNRDDITVGFSGKNTGATFVVETFGCIYWWGEN